MKRPEQAQIDKLPKWAQEYIVGIEREREVAITALNEAVNGSDNDSVWYDDLLCTGESAGPSHKRFNIPSRTVRFNPFPGCERSEVTVTLRSHEYPQRITISFDYEAYALLPSAGSVITLEPRPTRRYADIMKKFGYSE